MTLLPQRPKQWSEAAIWQDVEFGSYAADLPLWEELAGEAGTAVLEVGAGSGRVALHLARAGFEVLAVERNAELANELERRAEGLQVAVRVGDIATLGSFLTETATPSPRLAIAPLQVIQLLGEDERRRTLRGLAGALAPGGRFAIALVDESTLVERGVAAIPPDMREVEGWVYSSEPLWVQASETVLRMRRLRERVAPSGDLVRKVHDDLLHRLPPERLEAEARTAGLVPLERREIPSSLHEAGAIAVIVEVP
jgi:SAM-dependent methyltransferase